MPPILLLKKDATFYTDPFKNQGEGDPEKLENIAPPADTMSNVRVTNDNQRENRKDKLTENINDPDSRENPEFSGELIVKDAEKIKGEDDLGARFVKFLQTPIVQTTDEADKPQKKREVSRITGKESDAPATSEIRPIGEVPVAVGEAVSNFINTKLMNVLILFGGVYIAGEFIKGFGQGITKKGKIISE